MTKDKLLTVKDIQVEISDMIRRRGVNKATPSVSTLYRWLNEGKVFSVSRRIGANGWLVPQSEVQRVLREEDEFI